MRLLEKKNDFTSTAMMDSMTLLGLKVVKTCACHLDIVYSVWSGEWSLPLTLVENGVRSGGRKR